ncbi:MAG: hypothetical protein ACK56F_05140 [bacterium]
MQQWDREAVAAEIPGQFYLATQAARWGADRELEACCEYIRRWFADPQYRIAELRAARRPKPPSLKNRIAAAITDGDERKALKLLEELDDSL